MNEQKEGSSTPQIPVENLTSKDVGDFSKDVAKDSIKQALVWTLASTLAGVLKNVVNTVAKGSK